MIYTTDILGDQALLLLHAFRLGIILGACYELFRFGKLFCRKKAAFCAIADLLFCLWSGFLLFSFFLYENYGMPRMYLYAGTLAGFLLWYFTAGKVFLFLEKKLFRLLSTVLTFFFRPVLRLFEKIVPKVKNISGKALFYPKKLLKKSRTVMYNILCLNGISGGSGCGGTVGKEYPDLERAGNEKEKEESFCSDRGCCLRHLPSVFPDRHTGEHYE